MISWSRKDHVTRDNLSLQLAMQFLPKKYCRLQLGCQTYATCLRPAMRLYFKPAEYLKMSAAFRLCPIVIGQKIARQFAVGVSHAATCRVALRKVEAASTFSATWNAIFRWETSCKHGVPHEDVFLATCNAMQCHCVASCKENCLV